MSETTNENDAKKPLSLSRPGKLELKKTVATGQVRQSFSHGRSKTVTVEVKKKRTFARDSGGHMAEVKQTTPQTEPITEPAGTAAVANKAESDGMGSDAERAARARALHDALDSPPLVQPSEAETPSAAKIAEPKEARRDDDLAAQIERIEAKVAAGSPNTFPVCDHTPFRRSKIATEASPKSSRAIATAATSSWTARVAPNSSPGARSSAMSLLAPVHSPAEPRIIT